MGLLPVTADLPLRSRVARARARSSAAQQPRSVLARSLIAAAVGSAFATSSFANPTGGSVAAGSATFVVNGKTLTVTNTPGSIINWQAFSINKDEITRFIQQNANSAVLNRVVGQDPTAILGQLLSNGRVFLVNPNGMVFGNGAVIDVAGFAASSLRISDQQFLQGLQSGNFRFEGTGAEGKIQNLGKIQTQDGGHVYLIAPNVENAKSGVITSPKGEVVIAAGKTVELVNTRTPDIRVEFTAPQNEAINAGEVVANSGRIGIFGTLVKNSGIVSASRAEVGDGGKIVFKAVKDVTLDVTSKIEANGANGGKIDIKAETGTLLAQGVIEAKGETGKGGDIALLGNRVAVNAATVDASGKTGGGNIIIGGDFQGKNKDVQNAQRTVITESATIKADATGKGDGGKVIVWADGDTRYSGNITARGGLEGGDGGFVEVSGKVSLTFTGMVDTRAPQGKAGTLLLDPANFNITNNATVDYPSANVSATDGDWFFTDDPASSFITSATVVAILNNTNVNFQATGNIGIENSVNITYANTPNRDFTLTANESIILGGGVTIQSSGANGKLNIRFIADNDLNGSGYIAVGNGSVTTTLASNGGDITLGGPGTSPASSSTNRGIWVQNAIVDAGGGNITMRGNSTAAGLSGIVVASNSSITTSGTGSIVMEGTSDSFAGVTLNNNASASTTGSGTISLTGNTNSGASAVYLHTNGNVIASSGDITLQGVSSSTNGVDVSSSQVESTSGNVSLFADTVSLFAANQIVAGNVLTIAPTTASREIHVGTAGNGGVLALGAALPRLFASNVVIGGASQTGNIKVAGASAFSNMGSGGTLTLQTSGSANINNSLSTAGNVALIAGNGIAFTQSGVTAITAGGGKTVTLTAANGPITSTSANTDVSGGVLVASSNGGMLIDATVANVSLTNTVSGHVVFTNSTGVNIDAVSQPVGNLSITAAGAITQTGTITANASGATANFQAGANDITLTNAGNDFNTVVFAGGNVQLRDTNALAVGGSSAAGNLAVTAGGTISQTGAITANTAGTTANFQAGASDVMLSDAGNDFNTVVFAGGNVVLRDANALIVGASSVAGLLDVTAAGAITQTGAITANASGATANFQAGANDITLTHPGNDFNTVVFTGGNVSLRDVDALILGTSSAAGNLSVTTEGALTQTGAVSAPGTATFNTGTGAITLGNTSNDFGTLVLSTTSANPRCVERRNRGHRHHREYREPRNRGQCHRRWHARAEGRH
jgi:filamentous hemagglutinin family protein